VSDKPTPVRVMIGGPSGCIGYSQEELRVLESILAKSRSERTLIVHRALRIMCQAMLNSPESGYPGSLSDLNNGLHVSPSESGRINGMVRGSDSQGGGEQDPDEAWLLEASAKDQASQVEVTSTSDGAPDPDEPERGKHRQIASQFMA